MQDPQKDIHCLNLFPMHLRMRLCISAPKVAHYKLNNAILGNGCCLSCLL